MNNGKHQKKPQRESIHEFCKRLGIKQPEEKGGVEFLWNGPPYQGSQSYRRKRKTSEIFFSDEQDEFDALPEEYKDHLWRAFIHKAGLRSEPWPIQRTYGGRFG